MKRRAFLVTGGVIGGGLLVGVGGLSYVNNKIKEYSGIGMGDGHSLNAFIRIAPDNTVTLAVSKIEMGQGAYTSIPQLIAEELEIDLSKVKVVHPQAEGPYANLFMAENSPRNISEGLTMMQKVFALVPNIVTGGSTTIRDEYDYQRMIGAMAREMLISAAAKEWNVSPEDCFASKGAVFKKEGDEWKTYGDLASAAVNEVAPEQPKLKAKKDFKIIGQSINRIDIPEKINGSATFGLDVRLPGMKYAVIRHSSLVNGKISSILNEDDVRAMSGVESVVTIEEGIAVVASSTWHARNAAMALKVEEKPCETGYIDAISSLKEAMQGNPSKVWEDEGEIDKVIAGASKVIEAEYEVPYLAHACMEPMNCTVLYDGDKAEAWTGNQSSSFVVNGVSEGTGVSKDNIKTNITYLGGGFGRRGETDFVLEASKVAKNFPGTPIQMVYTREEDMKNDYYRPAVISQIKAAFSNDEVLGWKKKIGTQGALAQLFKRNVPLMPMNPEDDPSSTEGMRELPYKMDAAYTDLTTIDLPMNVGTWRSVGHSQNAFFSESFMDECAAELDQDSYEIRHRMLKDSPRHLAVLEKVAQISSWNKSPIEGISRGIALHESFGSIVGEVVEISLEGKRLKVDKVYCVIDCGNVVNPRIIESQMQSGIAYGLTAALYGEISLKDGKIIQNNFPNYEMVKMKTMPEVFVAIIDSDEYPGGVGEPSTPPIAPALTNAIFAATGERIRSLPLSKHGYKFV